MFVLVLALETTQFLPFESEASFSADGCRSFHSISFKNFFQQVVNSSGALMFFGFYSGQISLVFDPLLTYGFVVKLYIWATKKQKNSYFPLHWLFKKGSL